MKYLKGFVTASLIITIGILVAAAIVGIVIQKKNMKERIREQVNEVSTVAETVREGKPSPTVTTKPVTASSSTDAKLDKDFSDIDASMNAINTEGAAIDVGLNDQMGDLSE